MLYSWEKRGIIKPDWVSPGSKMCRKRLYSQEKINALFESCFQCENRNFTMISGSEAASIFHVSHHTILIWDYRGELPAVWVSPTGRRYYSKEQTEELYNQGYQTGTQS